MQWCKDPCSRPSSVKGKGKGKQSPGDVPRDAEAAPDTEEILKPANEETPLINKPEVLPRILVVNQPTAELKHKFLSQSYYVVIALCIVAFLTSLPFMLNPQGTVNWFSLNLWTMFLAIFILLLQLGYYVACLGALYHDGNDVLLCGYAKILSRWWSGAIWGFFFAVCSALITGGVLASFNWANVCIVYVYIAVDCVGLLLFMKFFKKKADFATMYAYLVPVFGAIFCGLLTDLFMTNAITECRWVALLISIVYGWILVFDTQMIYGSRHERGRKFAYHDDQWCFGGFEMYFDLWHFYFQSLRLMPSGVTQ